LALEFQMVDRDPPQQRHQRPPLSVTSTLFRLSGIAVIVLAAAGAFAYVGGYLDSQRLTPDSIIDTFEHNNGIHPGFRRNHPKGICVGGYFESNGAAAEFSSAQVFSKTRTPVIGRFALPTGNPGSPDGAVPVRSLALRFQQADGQQWRTAMNAMPVFAVSTPQAFVDLLNATAADPATGKPDPAKAGAFFASHPETASFLAWAKSTKPSASYLTLTYNSLNAFNLVDAQGKRQAVRWSVVPVNDIQAVPAPDTKDFLDADLNKHLEAGPLHWNLILTLANAGDPANDATKKWPDDRRTINAGTLVLDSSEYQRDGNCRDINYDPLILPSGIEGSDDPLLAARSAAYATSYKRRASEVDQLPKATPAQEQKQ